MSDPVEAEVGNTDLSKFILTIVVGEQAEDVEEEMTKVADVLNAGLTRSDWEGPIDEAGHYRKLRYRRLHRQGRLE